MNPLLLALLLSAARGQYAPVNGLSLYYEVHGGGTAEPPLVLLHGGGSTLETSFAKLLPALAKRRKVIAFDQQGHGRTADVDRPFSFEQSADDAAALLRFLKIERADFFGFSNGGTIALQIAIRHPEAVRKLVIASGAYRKDGFPPQFWQGMEHAKLEEMPAALRRKYAEVAPHPEALQSFFDKSVQRMLGFKDIAAEQVHAIGAPALVISGDVDVVTPEHSVQLFRLLPHGSLAIIPATDHSAMTDRPEPQLGIIEAFLSAPMR